MMPFLWNQGHWSQKHVWKCSRCGYDIKFNTRELAYEETRHHKEYDKYGESLEAEG